MQVENFIQQYKEIFQNSPEVISIAPGRAELIGNHTDYNKGYVMGTIMPFSTITLARRNENRKMRVFSRNFNELIEFDLDNIPTKPKDHWSDYLLGIILELKKSIKLNGFDAYIISNIPIGSGMSSSAALEISFTGSIYGIFNIPIIKKEIALIGYRAEHNFVKSNCGILDQFVSALGTKNKALLIDCKSESYELLKIPNEIIPIMVDTGIRRAAADALRARREEIKEAIKIIKRKQNIDSLRDLTIDDLEDLEKMLPQILFKRIKHVIEENERVIQMKDALEHKALEKIKELMYQSHLSSKDLYEVSIKELDILVELAHKQNYVYGTRLSGAGFGGCTINLVQKEKVNEFVQYILKEYFRHNKRIPTVFYGTNYNEFHINKISNS